MTQPATSARQAAIRIIAQLRKAGHTAYLAGGCVRDALLGKTPKDYDVATDATPEQVSKLYPRRSAAVGAAFGVVIVYTPKPSPRHRWVTEVATFRAEGAYSDGRRPDSVRFTTAEEDAQRRDFTINGLFSDPDPDAPDDSTKDQIIDFVDGRADLESNVIRAIGDPADRFGEDYLRMLRAIRFAARLGFAIEPRTSAAIRANAKYLGQISRERIGQEVLAMLNGPRPALAIRLLQEHKLDAPTLNEDPDGHELTASEQLPDDATIPTRLAAWLIDRHGRDKNPTRTITQWRKALSLSNDDRDEINRLLKVLPELDGWPELRPAHQKRLAAQEEWAQTLLLYDAIGGDAQRIETDAKQLAQDAVGLSPDPLLTGDDLIEAGRTPGPAFKTLLDEAYDLQLEGDLADREQALEWLSQADPG